MNQSNGRRIVDVSKRIKFGRAVEVLLITTDGRIYSHRRKTTQPGAYCGAAGKVEDSESATDAALRELKEEAGLTVDRSRMRRTGSFNAEGVPHIILFRLKLSQDEKPIRPEAEVNESEEWECFNLDELTAVDCLPGFAALIAQEGMFRRRQRTGRP